MIKWIKRLFCRHDYNIVEARRDEPMQFTEVENGCYANQKVSVAACCYCEKCGKTNKKLSRIIAKIRAKQVKKDMEHYIERQVKERQGQIFVKKI